MPNVLVKLAWRARSWQGFRSGGTRGSVCSSPLRGPFCSGAPAVLSPSGESMGKGDWAFSLPPPLLAGRDPRAHSAPLRGSVSAL